MGIYTPADLCWPCLCLPLSPISSEISSPAPAGLITHNSTLFRSKTRCIKFQAKTTHYTHKNWPSAFPETRTWEIFCSRALLFSIVSYRAGLQCRGEGWEANRGQIGWSRGGRYDRKIWSQADRRPRSLIISNGYFRTERSLVWASFSPSSPPPLMCHLFVDEVVTCGEESPGPHLPRGMETHDTDRGDCSCHPTQLTNLTEINGYFHILTFHSRRFSSHTLIFLHNKTKYFILRPS